MKTQKTTGIYAIRHIDSDWAYIGSSKSIQARWRGHKADLRLNRHHSPHLQNAWNKYGENAFVFEILETCFNDPVILYHREQVWINRAIARLYNASFQSEPGVGRTISPENRAMSSARMKGNKIGLNQFYRGVLTESDVKVILFRYASGDSVKDIAKEFKVSLASINRIARRKTWGSTEIPEDVETARINRVGKDQRGQHGSRIKLNFEIAEEIRRLWSDGVKRCDIGKRYEISTTHVRFIIQKKLWATPPLEKPELKPIEIPATRQLKPISISYRARKETKPRKKLERIIVDCANCGTKLARLPCRIRRQEFHYCNRKCSTIANCLKRKVNKNPYLFI